MKNPKLVFEFHPISLYNVVYEIISKMLSNRLHMVIRELVDEAQSVFIANRLITDNAILGIEAFHSMKCGSPFRTRDFCAVKLDTMKAYD